LIPTIKFSSKSFVKEQEAARGGASAFGIEEIVGNCCCAFRIARTPIGTEADVVAVVLLEKLEAE
jgi:hypothetical protein